MDFTNRGTAHHSVSRPAEGASMNMTGGEKKGGAWSKGPMWLKVMWMVLLFSGTMLVVAMLALLYFGGPNEGKYVNKDRFQAVFLDNNQVYFGKVAAVNKQFIDLRDIYYLSLNNKSPQPADTSKQETNITLIKLGCELHGPVDQMLINRDQVTYWENLKTDGEVVKTIDKWIAQNPDGQQKCNTTSASSNTDKKQ